MRISLVQFHSTADVAANAARAATAIGQAAADGADLVVFPEATMASFAAGRLDQIATKIDEFSAVLQRAATEHGVVVIAGAFSPADTRGKRNRINNIARVFSPQQPPVGSAPVGASLLGETPVEYRKIHTYDAFGYRESDTVRPGDALLVTPVPLSTADAAGPAEARVGVAICFDIRFPEQFVELARRGANLIVVLASWSAGPGKTAQWELLARARALDSTSFVIAVDQAAPVGSDPEVAAPAPTGVGHSVVVSPWGEVLARAGRDEEILTVDVDLSMVDQARKDIPVVALRDAAEDAQPQQQD